MTIIRRLRRGPSHLRQGPAGETITDSPPAVLRITIITTFGAEQTVYRAPTTRKEDHDGQGRDQGE